mmetsp:Transcript_9850/g.13001  ORF Transcript_9850/g.13001 Transcript_9850/m.13001 type:complete len:84 (-) Transcript_9850:285-536(-)|eukprot:CAMPEP_0198136476 /NCGR_PEP_ID=MMETSP1443-20131203/123_1 /TAXON_ID=186043 /ORGANISM="Entomoneis sp., Strain CCMP2396" /LENGTH=83 /DNA_ID=CAMNT_0043797701 /DNA_START=70 /DNA_END=321 /DNA_ORIENTATION=+
MDHEGQKLAEILFYIIICLFGAIGWAIGYVRQDFGVVFQFWSVGVVISVILCVPDWPFFNSHPIKWLESVPNERRLQASKKMS